MSDLTNTLLALVICLGFAGVGGYLFVSQQGAAADAVEVEATVVASEVVHEEVRDDDRVGREDRYSVRIEYRYTYEGETYTSTNRCAGAASGCTPSGSTPTDAEAFVEDHPAGSSVTAYVQPDEPSQAYLFESGASTVWSLVMVGGGLLGAAVVLRDLLGG